MVERIKSRLTFDLIELSSNPGMLTPQNIEGIVQTLRATPHQIRISFHGIEEATFESNMALPYRRCLSATIALLRAAEKNELCVMIKGLGRAREGGSRAADFGEDAFLRFWQKQCRDADVNFERFEFRYGMYHSRCGNTGSPQPLIRTDLSGFYCSRLDRWFHFLWDGSMILCCNDYAGESVFGNITEATLDEILAGDRYQTLSSMLLGKRPSPGNFLCKRCTSPGG